MTPSIVPGCKNGYYIILLLLVGETLVETVPCMFGSRNKKWSNGEKKRPAGAK
jgi:hypothetical protein